MTEKQVVEPVNTKRYEDSVAKDEYRFDKVHIGDVPRDFSQKGVEFRKGVDSIRWEYAGKCAILIHRDKVEAPADAPLEEAQNQAYFALSILADEGYVSRFQKK